MKMRFEFEELTWICGKLYPHQGGKLAPIAIRLILATTLSRTLVLSALVTLDVAPHSLFGRGKGEALVFNIDLGTSISLRSRMMVSG